MEDYLTEDDQWEALKRWLKENTLWIVGGVVLGGGLLFGYRWWQDHVTQRSEAAATEFEQLQTALAANKDAQAAELAGKLQKDYGDTPYTDQAQLALASAEVNKGELEKAAQRLSTVADKADDEFLREVARVRLARVQLAQNKSDEAIKTLDKVKAGAFSGMVSEVRGDALLAKGDRKGALDAYRAALLDAGDGTVLQLKINDLAGETPPAGAEPAKGAAPAAANPPADAAVKPAAGEKTAPASNKPATKEAAK